MPQQLVECVPNFSEGRRPEVVDAIVNAITSAGVTLLDRSSDHDHNRSVITFVGTPDAVVEAAFQGIKQAAHLINLDNHQGEHPRIGATDVVPFIPLEGITLEECAALARRLGQRVGKELGIPVYLYEAAATRPERTNLENIRRGEYEAFKASVETDASRAPDFGPAKATPAGATVIGARQFLIAYNVYLNTDDVEVAKKIAKAVRHSSGGLRFVKGLGLLVDGRAQISMNLTDYTKTPIAHVMDMIRAQAVRYGVMTRHSELVGLIPQAALIDAAVYYLQLDQFTPAQILESKLYRAGGLKPAGVEGQSVGGQMTFLDQVANGDPTPGGGSAAAYSGALAAALVAMVARITLGKKKYAEVQDRMAEIALQADKLRGQLEAAVQQDAAAFDQVMAVMKQPKEDPARAQALEDATKQAAAVPLSVARLVIEVFALAAEAAEKGNTNAATDAGSAGAMARAALTSAGLNVKINATSVSDQDAAQGWLSELQQLETQAAAYEQRIRTAVQERGHVSY